MHCNQCTECSCSPPNNIVADSGPHCHSHHRAARLRNGRHCEGRGQIQTHSSWLEQQTPLESYFFCCLPASSLSATSHQVSAGHPCWTRGGRLPIQIYPLGYKTTRLPSTDHGSGLECSMPGLSLETQGEEWP